MKIIIGLGNPDQKYNWTRHNFGFLALDYFAKKQDLQWKTSPKFHSLIAKTDNLLLAKPQTFYNASGEAAQKLVQFYHINPTEDLLVVCDDLNLDFGALRFRAKGTDGGNNGLKSIIANLNTTDFPRLRLGTQNAQKSLLADTDFVLSKFTPEEKAELPAILTQVHDFILTL
jgi:PTH1 family peptidyl-tRNA hydrolase